MSKWCISSFTGIHCSPKERHLQKKSAIELEKSVIELHSSFLVLVLKAYLTISMISDYITLRNSLQTWECNESGVVYVMTWLVLLMKEFIGEWDKKRSCLLLTFLLYRTIDYPSLININAGDLYLLPLLSVFRVIEMAHSRKKSL